MAALVQIEIADRKLLDSIGAQLAESARRSGAWLACRPGCTQCCIGPFDITQLDAHRLREGLRALAAVDPARAAAVRTRAEAYVLVAPASLDDLPCPALDPVTGYCDLYDARPITCRTFGPVTWIDEATLGACELCYTDATEQQMSECVVDIDPEGLEGALLDALAAHGISGMTIVASALAADCTRTPPAVRPE